MIGVGLQTNPLSSALVGEVFIQGDCLKEKGPDLTESEKKSLSREVELGFDRAKKLDLAMN